MSVVSTNRTEGVASPSRAAAQLRSSGARRRASVRLRRRRDCLRARLFRSWFGSDIAPPSAARTEYPGVPKQRIPRRRDQGRESRHEFEAGHDPVLRTAVAKLLDAIRDASAGLSAQTFESQGRPGSVAHQALPPQVVVGSNGDVRVQIEAVQVDGASFARSRFGRSLLVLVGIVVTKRFHRAPLHGNRAARIEQCGPFDLSFRSCIEQPSPSQPSRGACQHASNDALELAVRRSGRWVEDSPSRVVPGEHAVEQHRVKVHVQVDARTKALNVAHGAGGGRAETLALRPSCVAREDSVVEDS